MPLTNTNYLHISNTSNELIKSISNWLLRETRLPCPLPEAKDTTFYQKSQDIISSLSLRTMF